jgi:HD-like signal output (HDOD) protein
VDLSSLEIKLARSENLPVLPQVVSSVLRLADDPDASPREMEKIIERDPGITAKILRVANSAYYGLNQVPSIGRALTALGMNTVRSLVVGVAYQQVMAGREMASHYSKLEFWRHSLAVASACRILGKLKMPGRSEELYGAGMMHDVGMLVMDRFYPNEFDAAIKAAQAELIPLHDVEVGMYGFDHTEVGALLAEKWGLTDIMRHAIRYHHSPYEDAEHADTTAIVNLANGLAHQSGLTNNVPLPTVELDEFAIAAVEVPEEQFGAIRNVLVQEVIRAQEAFQIH